MGSGTLKISFNPNDVKRPYKILFELDNGTASDIELDEQGFITLISTANNIYFKSKGKEFNLSEGFGI
jgi:hypothetical protein